MPELSDATKTSPSAPEALGFKGEVVLPRHGSTASQRGEVDEQPFHGVILKSTPRLAQRESASGRRRIEGENLDDEEQSSSFHGVVLKSTPRLGHSRSPTTPSSCSPPASTKPPRASTPQKHRAMSPTSTSSAQQRLDEASCPSLQSSPWGSLLQSSRQEDGRALEKSERTVRRSISPCAEEGRNRQSELSSPRNAKVVIVGGGSEEASDITKIPFTHTSQHEAKQQSPFCCQRRRLGRDDSTRGTA